MGYHILSDSGPDSLLRRASCDQSDWAPWMTLMCLFWSQSLDGKGRNPGGPCLSQPSWAEGENIKGPWATSQLIGSFPVPEAQSLLKEFQEASTLVGTHWRVRNSESWLLLIYCAGDTYTCSLLYQRIDSSQRLTQVLSGKDFQNRPLTNLLVRFLLGNINISKERIPS